MHWQLPLLGLGPALLVHWGCLLSHLAGLLCYIPAVATAPLHLHILDLFSMCHSSKILNIQKTELPLAPHQWNVIGPFLVHGYQLTCESIYQSCRLVWLSPVLMPHSKSLISGLGLQTLHRV